MEESCPCLDSRPHSQAFVEIPHHPSLSVTGDLTIEFRLLLRSWPSSWTDIVSKFQDDGANEFCFRIRDGAKGQWYYGDGSRPVPPLDWTPREDMELGQWTHIACVRKAGQYGKIYVNGRLRRHRDWQGQPHAAPTEAAMVLMAKPSQRRFQNGILADLRLWNVARSEQDIQASMEKAPGVSEEGLVGCWTFSPGADGLAIPRDRVGGNHGVHHAMNRTLDLRGYDFVDFGCQHGGSIALARKLFDGGRGIGLDISIDSVRKTRRAGYDAEWFDVTRLSGYRDQVRFVIMSHFLEHLAGYGAARACIRAASIVARDFIYMEHPFFDADAWLFSHGLKLYWSDWTGHPNRLTSFELYCILRDLCREGLVHRFKLYRATEIVDSDDQSVHPLQSPPDQHGWRSDIHPPKPRREFHRNVFRELRFLATLNDRVSLEELEKRLAFDDELFCSYD